MLVLSRDLDEQIEIGQAGDVLDGPITIKLLEIRGKTKARIGIDAPDDIGVHRGEVAEQRRAEAVGAVS